MGSRQLTLVVNVATAVVAHGAADLLGNLW